MVLTKSFNVRCLFLFSVSSLLLLCVVSVTAHDDGGYAPMSAVTMLTTEGENSENKITKEAKAAAEKVLHHYNYFFRSLNEFSRPLNFLFTEIQNIGEEAKNEDSEFNNNEAMISIRKVEEKINAEKEKVEELKKSESSMQNKLQSIQKTINDVSKNIAELTTATTSRKSDTSIDHRNVWEKMHNIKKMVKKVINISKGLLNETAALVKPTEELQQMITTESKDIELEFEKLMNLRIAVVQTSLENSVQEVLDHLQSTAKEMYTSSTDGQKYAAEATEIYDELLKRVENTSREIEEGNSNIYSTRNAGGKKQQNDAEGTATTLTGEELMSNAQNNTQHTGKHLRDNGTNKGDVRTKDEHELQTEKGENETQLGPNNTNKATKGNLNHLLAEYMGDSSRVVVANILICFALPFFVVLFNNF